MKRYQTLGVVAVLAALGAAACASPRTPDEFRVVRKAPLTVPPDYNLRPPAPGEGRPQELASDAAARVAVFGTDIGKEASPGEKLFITAAGGEATDRTIRQQVDYDSTQTLRKNRSFADTILNFGKGPKETVVDPAAETERLKGEQDSIKEVTGGGQVLIRHKNSSKLPGL